MTRTLKTITLWLLILTMTVSGLLLPGCTKEENVPDESESETEPAGTLAVLSDYYVSPDGDDANDGSESAPFATPEKAAATLRALRDTGSTDSVTFHIKPGEYAVRNIHFEGTDGGATLDDPVVFKKDGDGEVIFNAGRTIGRDAFSPVTDDAMLARFTEEAAAHILVCDLAAAGLTKDDIGPVYAVGCGIRPTSDDYVGTTVGVYWGDTFLNMARYPNTANQFEEESFMYLEEGAVLDPGDSTHGGTLRLDEEAATHVDRWATTEGTWVYDYFDFNWSQEESPISGYDPETKAISLLFPANAYKAGNEFYLFNAPEELDFPGEYWIDRDNLKLYVYPTEEEGASASISFSRKPMFTGTIRNMTFEGITFTGVCDTIFAPDRADGLTIRDCVLKNSEIFGLQTVGDNNTIYGCEMFNLGWGGGFISYKDNKATLTPDNNVFENNYVHHVSQVYRMYGGGFSFGGVGNVIRHNEFAYLPHSASGVGSWGNLTEWNYYHDIVQEASDAGALYGGGQWDSFGVVQYNKFERIGNERCRANGIYFDDMLSGMTARNNVLIDVAGFAFMCGGGRGNTIENNVCIECTGFLYYDDRMRTRYANAPDDAKTVGGMWDTLDQTPETYASEPWMKANPSVSQLVFDTTDIDNPNFPINPTGSVIQNNIWIKKDAIHRWDYQVWDTVYQYSTIGYYYTHNDVDRVFEPGTYELTKVAARDKNLVYEPIPYEGFGCYAD